MISEQNILQIGETFIYSGTLAMIVPTGGPIQRHVEIRLPYFASPPNVVASVFTNDNPFPPFNLLPIQINTLELSPGDFVTQIVIDAQNSDPTQIVESKYWCCYVATGMLANRSSR